GMIPRPRPSSGNQGLVDSLTSIQKGSYADVIVQLVFSSLSIYDENPCLLVWDGSDWPFKERPLSQMDSENLPPDIPADPAIRERARGRMVTIFTDDYQNQFKHSFKSGDWLYVQNVHCYYKTGASIASFYMHKNYRPRYIWRLDLPIEDGLFYEKQWRAAMERVSTAQPLPLALIPLNQRPPQPAAAPKTPRDRLHKLIVDEIAKEGIQMPESWAEFEALARSAVAAMRDATSAAPAAATPLSRPQPAAVDEQPCSSTAVAPSPGSVQQQKTHRRVRFESDEGRIEQEASRETRGQKRGNEAGSADAESASPAKKQAGSTARRSPPPPNKRPSAREIPPEKMKGPKK
ncbi:hypothetical protein PMAYCL1PPCAC_31744, partial [Pristionchus mayeri]